VFFEKSPRHIEPAQAAHLAASIRGRAEKVALIVNASDARFAEIVAALDPDWLQLHGAETPERTREIRQKFGRPVIKALGVADHADLLRTQDFLDVADRLLFDAKPPKNAVLPGGNGLSFDWTLLQNYAGPANWMLSGGLTPENVAEAIRLTRAPGVDVSSGVEDAPGVKSAEKIHAFIKAARAA
jgi:phosphoribosylanthranilate isomerase